MKLSEIINNKKLGDGLFGLVLLVIIISLIYKYAIGSWPNISNYILPDNDDAMRVIEVRDWLNGQGFFDGFNHRLNPPNGGDVHWSRIGDLPLAFIELILKPFGLKNYESIAVFITPLLLSFVFALSIGKAAFELEKSKITFAIAAIMALNVPIIMSYFIPGRVDHHNIQIICLVLAVLGALKIDVKGAVLSGFAMALSLTIGFETMPQLVIIIAWFTINWLLNPSEFKNIIIAFCQSFAIFIICGFLINVPPSEWNIPVNDALSIAQILPILIGSVSLMICANYQSEKTFLIRFLTLGAIGVCVIASALQYPVLLQKPYFQTDELMHKLWLSKIVETHPLISVKPKTLVNLGMFAVLASIAAIIQLIVLFKRETPSQTDSFKLSKWFLICGLVVISSIMAFFWQARVAGIANSIAIIVVSSFVTYLFIRKRYEYAIIALVILNPFLPQMISNILAKSETKTTKYAVGGGKTCKGVQAFSSLAKMPKGLIAAPIDFGAQALIATHHSVLAAPYHRNQGNRKAYDIFIAEPETAKKLLIQNKIDYVAICAKSAEIVNIANYSPNGLMAMLKQDKYPNYLEPIETPKKSNIIAYKIIKEKTNE